MRNNIYGVTAVWLLIGVVSAAYANGFALNEQSASGMGNAFAGGGASAEDASTIFFNPAGMTYLPDNQLVIAGHAIRPSADFDNNGSRSAGGFLSQGGNGGDATEWAFIPNFYAAKALNDNVRLGLGIYVPFAYKTDYAKGWVGRYQALKTELTTININPSVAFKVNDQISLGLGFSAMRMEAELSNAVDFGTICAIAMAGCGTGASFQNNDGFARVTGDDWGFGWNAGVVFQITDATRFALSYRSVVEQQLEGRADFNQVPAAFAVVPALEAGFAGSNVRANFTAPDSASASVFHQLDPQWDVMADLTWTHWSTFQDLTVVRTSGALAGRTLSSVPQNWDNTFRVALAASYHYSERLKLRAGLAYDESPVTTEFRTPRTANTDRYWLSLGAQYKFTPSSSVDIGYTYIFVDDAALNKTTDTSIPALRDSVKGEYESNANMISAQFTHAF